MSFIKSFLYNMKEAKYNPITLTHSILYVATVTYLRVLKNLLRFGTPSIRKHVGKGIWRMCIELGSSISTRYIIEI